jgi:hypothetical protein
MLPDLSKIKLPPIVEKARPSGDTEEEQHLKYHFHRQANGTLQYYIDSTQYLAAYVLAFSFLEDRLKALGVIFYRDYRKKQDYQKSIDIDLKRLIGNIYKDNDDFLSIVDPNRDMITEIFIDNLHTILQQRNKLIHEAMWRRNAIALKDIDIILEAKKSVYSHQRKLMRHIKNSTPNPSRKNSSHV